MHFMLTWVFGLLFGICFANHNGPDPVCNLPADSGLCYAHFPMFYYDAPSGSCMNFIYGGCGGNDNRFWKEEECLKRCGGDEGTENEPVDEGPIFLRPTVGGQGDIPQKPVDGGHVLFPKPVDGGQQVVFPKPTDGGKGVIFQKPIDGLKGVIFQRPAVGKGTIFPHLFDGGKGVTFQHPVGTGKGTPLQQAPLSDICNQEKQPGNCSSQITRFYFSKDSGKCESFMYSGCGKNDNNFVYEFECERTCPGEHDLGDVCNFHQEPGPCRAYFPRFYFSTETGQCEQFIYGGCRGNHNNFKTKEECLRYCTSGKGSPLP